MARSHARRMPSGIITLANYSDHVRYQKWRSAQRAAENKRLGIVVLTELTEEQLLEDKRDEAICWPHRWW